MPFAKRSVANPMWIETTALRQPSLASRATAWQAGSAPIERSERRLPRRSPQGEGGLVAVCFGLLRLAAPTMLPSSTARIRCFHRREAGAAPAGSATFFQRVRSAARTSRFERDHEGSSPSPASIHSASSSARRAPRQRRYSSMAERLFVEQETIGSIPTGGAIIIQRECGVTAAWRSPKLSDRIRIPALPP